MKICVKCKEIKDLSHYGKDSTNKSGLRSRCKLCRSKDSKEWNKTNPDRLSINSKKWYLKNPEKARNMALKRKYGITLDQFNQLSIQQEDKCPICNKHKDILDQSMSVDHCHKTGKVRALLCNPCNAAVGFIQENVENAQRLVQYIKLHKEDQDGNTI